MSELKIKNSNSRSLSLFLAEHVSNVIKLFSFNTHFFQYTSFLSIHISFNTHFRAELLTYYVSFFYIFYLNKFLIADIFVYN